MVLHDSLFINIKDKMRLALEIVFLDNTFEFYKVTYTTDSEVQNRQRDLTTCRDIKRGNTQVT